VRIVFGFIVLLFALPASLAAQDTNKLDVFGGYEYQTVGGNLGWQMGSPYSGWDASATFKLTRRLGVSGDFSGNYHNGTYAGYSYYSHILTYAGGPVYSFASVGNFTPFAHVLFGESHITTPSIYANPDTYVSGNGFTVMFGGGADYKVKKNISIRLAQFDWIDYVDSDMGKLINHGSGGNRSNSPNFADNARICSGIVFHF